MTDRVLNIWSNPPDILAESSTKSSPRLPPQSPRIQEAWSPHAVSRDKARCDALAQARVLAIFRSGRFPNRVESPCAAFEDLEPDALDELESSCSFEEGVDEHGKDAVVIRPDFHDEEPFGAEESFSSSGSSSSSRSTPVQDWIPHWQPRFRAVLSSRSREECANGCRALILSSEWEYEDLGDLAHQLVSSVLTGVPPLVITACAASIKRILLDISKHEAASYFVSCLSGSAFAAWHHYWNPGTSFSIYPGRPFLVTEQHLNAGYSFSRLVGSLFKSKLISRTPIQEIIDLTLENAILLEHIDVIGYLLSYATPEVWSGALDSEKDRMVIELYDVLERLCEYHSLRPELMEEYEKKVEEICTMVVKEE